jgi:hypothetical protein
MKDDEKNINLKKKITKKQKKNKRKDEELIQIKRKRKLLKRFLYIKQSYSQKLYYILYLRYEPNAVGKEKF